MWLLFLLLAVIALAIILYLPLGAGLGYLVVITWIALMLYLVFYREDAVSQTLEKRVKEVKP
ncbi:MAG: hypothetical protein HYU86_08445 [Chloroflexi bacterium]|nr:hypothetical protein [Chloroflexota bacterium]